MVATYNVRTLAVKGRNGYGHAESVLAKARQLACDFCRPAGNKESWENRVLYSRIPSFLHWARNGWQARTAWSWFGN